MPRRIVAIVAAVVGIYLLAGLGWALLTLAVLVEVAWPQGQPRALGAVAARSAATVQRLWTAARQVPKQSTAAGSLVSGLVLVPVGLIALGGWGVALLALGTLLLILGVVLDRSVSDEGA